MLNKRFALGSALLLSLFLSGCQSNSLDSSSSMISTSEEPSSEVATSISSSETLSSSPTSSETLPVFGTELFFSEYIEGPGINKVIELFNPTDETVDLTKYTVKLFSNGRTLETVNIMKTMEGSLPAGETFVFYSIASDTHDTALLATVNAIPADRKWVGSYDSATSTGTNVANHNGNDALGLFKNNGAEDILIDVIGVIGNDPGTAWTATFANGTGTTKDSVLTRIPSVHGPSIHTYNSLPNGFDPLQWNHVAYPSNTPAVHTVGTHLIS